MNILLKKIKILDKFILKNFIALSFNRGSTLFLQLILVPITIKLLGKSNYGEWLMISTLPSYLLISDFGLNTTVTTSICSLIANNNYTKAISLYKSATTFILLVGLFIVILLYISTYHLHWNHILNLKVINKKQAEESLIYLTISTFISIIAGLLLGIYRAEGKYYLSEFFTGIFFMIDPIVFIISLFYKYSFVSISIFQIIWRLIFVSIFIFVIKKKYSWFDFKFTTNFKPVLDILPTSLYYLTFTLGYNLMLYGSIFIVGKFLGPVTLVIFNTSRTLANSLKSFSSTFYFSYLPKYTVLIAKHENVQAKFLFKKMIFNTFIISFILLLIYQSTSNILMFFWTNNNIKIEEPFFSILLLSVFFGTLGNASYVVLNATNENKRIGISYFFISLIYLLTIYIGLSQGYQLIFISLCLLTSEIILLFLQFNEARKKINF